MKRIAIIGAGLSGVILGQKLSQKADVVIFEKAKGVGGRMSTRYAYPFVFDHGAQCFTARTKDFQTFLSPFMESGIIAEWKGQIINLEVGKECTSHLYHEPHLVAAPNMNSLCKAIAASLNIRTNCEVAPLTIPKRGKWKLYTKDDRILGDYDWVISTLPPEQTLHLFGRYINENEPINLARMQSCYALMLGFNKPFEQPLIAAKVYNNPIKWISVNSSKPKRNSQTTCFVIHSRANWAKLHIDYDIQKVETFLLKEFSGVTNIDIKNPDYISTHRWRYSIVGTTNKPGSYIDVRLGLAATSDWCETSRIEQVWFHAQKLGDFIFSNI